MNVANLWQNAVLFFPGDKIPDPLPLDKLYLYVSAKYKGDEHNQYSAVKSMLENTHTNRVVDRRRNDFTWMHVKDSDIDELFGKGINILCDVPGFGPVLRGNRINGTLLIPAELWVFGEVLRRVRVAIGGMWEVFLYGERPDADSRNLMDNVHRVVVDTMCECEAKRYLRKFTWDVKTHDRIYAVGVQIGAENFLIVVDVTEPSVTINVAPTLMRLLENVIGLENIGVGDIVVDYNRPAMRSLTDIPVTYGIARSFVVGYSFKILE